MGGGGIKGGPQCRGTVAKGVGVIAWLKDGGRGPKPMREAQGRCWQKLQDWIRQGRWRTEQTDGSRDRGMRAVDSLGHPEFGRGIRRQVRGKGVAVYRMIWSMDHGVASGRLGPPPSTRKRTTS